ncbi:Uncharacterized protein APZ42_007202 [Daphnia magna]|uniref:Uncharacterized protein n=1 Tax=Daphnia magna TaxID=35525 RepID=A0A162D2B5_9CRUS|nr:Uncharacterized protein APZ42_007202 [Daphnia magna]
MKYAICDAKMKIIRFFFISCVPLIALAQQQPESCSASGGDIASFDFAVKMLRGYRVKNCASFGTKKKILALFLVFFVYF